MFLPENSGKSIVTVTKAVIDDCAAVQSTSRALHPRNLRPDFPCWPAVFELK